MVNNSLAHDLQIDPPVARPYLPRRYQMLVYGFFAAVALFFLLGGFFLWQRSALQKNLAVKQEKTSEFVSTQTTASIKAVALHEQLEKAKQLASWVSLGSVMQQFYLDVVETLDPGTTLTELNVVRARSQPQLTMEIAFAAEQNQATLAFQKTLGVLLKKGYRTVTVDQSNFAGGVKFSCTLIYPKRS